MSDVPTFDQVMAVTRGISSHTAFEEPECRAYYDLLCSLPDGATVLEIGLQFGRSSSIVAQLEKAKKFRYIGVDPFTQPPDAQKAWIDLMRRLAGAYQLYKMKSADVPPLPPLDLALIDGDHWADGVRTDCRLVLPLIKAGGYALFHDYGREPLPDVYPTVHAEMIAAQMTGDWQELPTVGTLGIWRNGKC